MVRSLRPPDYETPVCAARFVDHAERAFYVRIHMPVPPSLDRRPGRCRSRARSRTPLTLSLDEIRRMPSTTADRDARMRGQRPRVLRAVGGRHAVEKGAVGTARWTGVRMADVLKRAGIKPHRQFVVMNGADPRPGTMPDFVRQSADRQGDASRHAHRLRDERRADTAVHGFPLRAIVPGWEGAYAMKWLTNLRVIDKRVRRFLGRHRLSLSDQARDAWRGRCPLKDMAPLTGLAVKSLITRPLDGATHAPGKIDVAGFAWAGENDIPRVDVSADSGATWQPAPLTGEHARYTWRRFETQSTPAKPESYLIMSRATDSKGRTQPDVAQWNPSGYLWNAPDRVRVEVK